MRFTRRLARPLLGLALLLHGLALTVLPLRGADMAQAGAWHEPVTALYVIAIVGFAAAGLGVLGARPMRFMIMPAVLVAGVAALGAQFWQGDPDLWAGVVLSALLPLLAVLQAVTMRHAPASRHPWWRVLGDVTGVVCLGWIALAAMLWPWHRAWGTEPVEWQLALPGDHVPRTPGLEIMHAVTVNAPPDAVWPWLVQIGQDRGGFYSYTWLERAFGAHITNTDRIHPEWQTLSVGDPVHAVQPDYLGGLFSDRPGWVVDRLEPNRALVLRHWGAFVLTPLPDGRTRFVVRSTISHDRIPAWLAAVNFTAFELPHFIMQRRMLLGIKERAERGA